MNNSRMYWTVFFYLVAAFNFSMGGPIIFTSAWSYSVTYIVPPDAATLRFWGDFGYAVLLIGLGYAIIGFDVPRNHGIVWLGIVAKLFDMIALPVRC